MAERVFVDTNVWVYAIDGADPRKRDMARSVLDPVRANDLAISAQVLSEFYVVASRRMEFTRDHVLEMVDRMSRLAVVRIDEALVLAAIAGSRDWGISYWDALIVRAAETGGCRLLVTEDLSHGQMYGTVTVRNPFV